MADNRTYVRVHDGMPDHPKIIEVGGMAAWLYTTAMCYASRQLTDGVIPARLVPRLTDLPNPEALASALLRVGLLHASGHDCSDCPDVGDDEYVIHDYLEHQRSADYVRTLREKRSAAGQKGGRKSGETRRAASENEAKDEALASALLKQTRSKTQAETETETEVKEQRNTSKPAAPPPPVRADVERVCKHLADRLVATGSKRPTIDKKWRDSARLLLDKDGVTVDQALKAIDWAHANTFWQAHILTPTKLRTKFETLRRQAQAEQRENTPAARPQQTAIDELPPEVLRAKLRF
ncbi:hypothetical protein [Embleya sp. NPDC001921]